MAVMKKKMNQKLTVLFPNNLSKSYMIKRLF